jgi:GTP cyclohydrolase I
VARICQRLSGDPAHHLERTFEEVGGYDEIVLLKDIPFQSHCEHHLAPIIGKASIAYLPRDKVVGISKLARVLHGFARRLQVQERLTARSPTASASISSPRAWRW